MSFLSLGDAPKELPVPGYAYKCEDNSILKPLFYKLFVLPLSNLLGPRTAPNDVTFVSQIFSFLPVIFALWFAERNPPSWSWAVIPVVGFFGYIVLDHLDGTHARKTNQSSPLGELVDHWCDAWNGAFVPFAWALCYGAHPRVVVLLAIVGAFAYTAAIAEHKVTGVLKLDRMGGNEGMILMCGTLGAITIFGRDKALHTQLALGYTVTHLLQFLHGVGCVGTVKNVLVRSGTRTLPDLAPLAVGSVLVLWWRELGLDHRIACFMLAAISAIVAGRLVLFRATALPIKWDGVGPAVLLLGIVIATFLPDPQTQLWTGSIACLILVARAFADFGWGCSAMSRWIRPGETLSIFFAPRPVELPLTSEQAADEVSGS